MSTERDSRILGNRTGLPRHRGHEAAAHPA